MILNHLKIAIIFMKSVTSVVAINFVTKNFHLKQNGVTCIKFTESSRAGGKGPREDLLPKYLTLLFFVSDLPRLKVSVLEVNN